MVQFILCVAFAALFGANASSQSSSSNRGSQKLLIDNLVNEEGSGKATTESYRSTVNCGGNDCATGKLRVLGLLVCSLMLYAAAHLPYIFIHLLILSELSLAEDQYLICHLLPTTMQSI